MFSDVFMEPTRYHVAIENALYANVPAKSPSYAPTFFKSKLFYPAYKIIWVLGMIQNIFIMHTTHCTYRIPYTFLF